MYLFNGIFDINQFCILKVQKIQKYLFTNTMISEMRLTPFL